jgi:hypothetical protein
MAQNKVKAATRGTLAGMSLSGTYQAINATPFAGPCFRIAIYNTTNGAIDISYDGSTDNDVVPATSFIVIDAQTNAQPNADMALFKKNLVVYAKGSSAAGTVYVSGYYVAQ